MTAFPPPPARPRLLHGRAFVGGEVREQVTVAIDGGAIAAVRVGEAPPVGAERVEGVLAPGFVDLHVHGGAGADFMDGTVEAVRTACAFHARHGTVALAATTLSAGRAAVGAAVAAAAAVAREPRPGEAHIAGIHLEGPYLNPAKAGAQDPAALRAADREEVEEWLAAAGPLPVLMTLAPEVPGALELIEALAGRVTFSLGHTEASAELAAAALRRGARHFTHLWNAMPPLHHRRPGTVGAALASEAATVELIADGLHVHPLLLAACARLLPDRVALVTDAMRAAGMPPGAYRLGSLEVEVGAGAARLADGTLAGSLLTMDAAVRTMVRAGLPLARVLPLASAVPARVLGLSTHGRIAAGAAADLVALDEELTASRVWIAGEQVA
ncbi:MAG TPA: N-acetylglucosamine-6-phosphate deacetylase [Thermoanaerobaculia bacterium]|nr:N-acetylglucosamine-6-phosphate deacetylase [Thermoanaerobaculia bacterium]